MVSYQPWETQVSEVRGKMDRGELIPDPEWQRGYIWNLEDEQKLIDSILRGIPIPNFYLTEDWDPKKGASIHYVVDGQQRLKAIYRFLDNRYCIEIRKKQCYFKDLNNKTQKTITNYKLNGHYMRDYGPSDISFLFQRLNSTGIKLTNMESWNNTYYGTKGLEMIRGIYEEICEFPHKRDYRDYDDKDMEKLKASYIAPIYTPENIKRMLPLDDIIDLAHCLKEGRVEGGSKKEIDSFLKSSRKITSNERSVIESKFRKVLNNMRGILSRDDLESSLYSKRTHFMSLFLAIGLLIPNYYILGDVVHLKKKLVHFINNQPEEYKENVLGGIRQKTAREKRTKFLREIILKWAKELDKKRFFDRSLKYTFWSTKNHNCKICGKPIKSFTVATLDHIEPWAKGGRTIKANAQLAHRSCNQSKSSKYEEFVIVT